MKTSFFPKLALDGMRKNKKLYVPYLLSCTGMTVMYYIIHSLSASPLLQEMRGGGNAEAILSIGKFVIAVFALIFLFYTNSVLLRCRTREFGLYSVLGMDKRGIRRILFWETLFTALVSLVGGLLCGTALSKLAELGLLRMIRAETDFRFVFSPAAVLYTVGIFGGIFVLLFFRSLIRVRRASPLDLLRSEAVGEKPPRGNLFLALCGLCILAGAYAIAVSIQSPLSAIPLFFVAVLMVIAATYLLFISGSVALCRLLQKNRKFYYKKQHFTSVSSMAFRMKRNGAGLASICILCTMVLVMISSTSSLYFGIQDSIASRFPLENEIDVDVHRLDNLNQRNTSLLRAAYEQVFENNGVTPEKVAAYGYAEIGGIVNGADAEPFDPANGLAALSAGYDRLRTFYFVSAEDYNAAMGTDLRPEPGQALVYTVNCTWEEPRMNVGGVSFTVSGHLESFIGLSEAFSDPLPTVMCVISDLNELHPLEGASQDGERLLLVRYCWSYDLDGRDEDVIRIFRDMQDVLWKMDFLTDPDGGGYSYYASCFASEKSDFFTTYGGLFFLGIVLSVIFIFAAAMIIYYKQLSEGYEDQARFDVMRKVGMTREDIRKSVNSQILCVFSAPLLAAGLHLCFAFPMIWKILTLFNMHNLKFVILTTVIAFLIFAAVYAVIYKLTSRAYCAIVEGADTAQAE